MSELNSELVKVARGLGVAMPDQELIDEGMGDEVLHAGIRIELEDRFLATGANLEEGDGERLAIFYSGQPAEYVVDEVAVTADWEGDMDGLVARFEGFWGTAFGLVPEVLAAMGLAKKFAMIGEFDRPVHYQVWLGPEAE